MTFGVNAKLNYVGIKKKDTPKKVHQPDTPTTHLDDLDDKHNKPKEHSDNKPEKPTDPTIKAVFKSISDNHDTELLLLLGASSLSTFLIAKYVV